jgi:hypothetical protein
MNFKKFFNKQTVSKQTTFNEEDIALLAFMCYFCAPDVTKKGFCLKHYAYYIPDKDKDLDIAKDLFETNGVNMQIHYSFIKGRHGQYVLRMRYKNKKDYNLYKGVFTEIVKKSDYFTSEEGKASEAQMSQRLEQVREIYKGR